MTLPKVPVVFPSVLAGKANGQLPDNVLVEVGPFGRLVSPAARSFKALQWHSTQIGLPLTYTFGGCYRDFISQLNLFLSRYEPCSYAQYLAAKLVGRGKYWELAPRHGYDSKYWRKKLINGRYPATAAAPGSSNHGWGLAVDTAYDKNPADGIHPRDAWPITSHPAWEMFKALVVRCGFSWELDSEPWHIRYVTGDDIPEFVLNTERHYGTPPVAPAPAPVPDPPLPAPQPVPPPPAATPSWTETLIMDLPTLRQGDTGKNVKRLQGLLVADGHKVTIDGTFGQGTLDNVRWFQGTKGLATDGIVGRATWTALLLR